MAPADDPAFSRLLDARAVALTWPHRTAPRSPPVPVTSEEMRQTPANPALIGERPEMSDEERDKALAELAELIVDPTWLDREALKELEKHEDDW